MIVEQPGHPQDRIPQPSRAEIAFVRDAFLVEGQHVGDRRPHIQDGDGVIVVAARLESRQRLQSRDALEHREPEAGISSHPEGDCREARPIKRYERSLGGKLAATTSVGFHFPPPAVISSTPFSWNAGSLSSRAISQGPMGRTPAASSPLSVLPNLWKVVTNAESTPCTASIAA